MFGSLSAVTVLICALSSLNVRGAPAVKIVASAGQTVILPCRVQVGPGKNVLDVEWTKKDGTPHGAFVFVYRVGSETTDKNDTFLYRTHLFTRELKDGNTSLRLSDVRLSDAGNYTCRRTKEEVDCEVELSVGAASEPTLKMVPGQDVTLQCEASCWFPKPDITILDAEGNAISAEDPKYSQDPQSGCYNVTRRATVQAGNNFTCRVNQSEINRTSNTEIHIPDNCIKSCIVPIIDAVFIAIAIGIAIGFVIANRNPIKTKIASLLEKYGLELGCKKFCIQSAVQNSTSSKDQSPNPRGQDPSLLNQTTEHRSTLMNQSPGTKPAASTTGIHSKPVNLPKSKGSKPKSEMPPCGACVGGSSPASSPDVHTFSSSPPNSGEKLLRSGSSNSSLDRSSPDPRLSNNRFHLLADLPDD